MQRLHDPGLPTAVAKKLNVYQAEVNNSGDYPTQVAEGKRLFGSRKSDAAFRTVRERLAQMCAGAQRCVYCEDSVGDEVEHIKPKDLYPEEVFRWPNYVYACGPCNSRKNNKFAVITDAGCVVVTRRRGKPITPPEPGEPAFINPRIENPRVLITMDLLGTFFVLPRDGLEADQTSRADFTIETLGLNRDLLLEARKNAFSGYRARLSEYHTKRESGATEAELWILRSDLLSNPHPTVWEEMKCQADDITDIGELFKDVPEAREWHR